LAYIKVMLNLCTPAHNDSEDSPQFFPIIL